MTTVSGADDADRATVVKVAFDPQQVVVQFGTWTATSGAEREALTASMTRAIAMPPATAVRLLDALDDALREIAARGGPLRAETGVIAESAPVVPTSETAARAPEPEPMLVELPVRPARAAGPVHAGQGRRVLEQVAALGAPYGHERSFRLCPGALLANRFLLSLAKSSLPGAGDARAEALCRELGMPEDLLARAREALPGAHFLHVGFEEDRRGCLCKVYLELAAGRAAAGDAPVLQHLAFKWDPDDPARRAVTRYVRHPGLDAEGIRARLAHVYRDGGHDESREIAESVLAMAARRVLAQGLPYLEVDEEEGARRSFDLNVYDAKLRIRDLKPAISRMRRKYGVSPGRLQELYDGIKDASLGHVAGGVHREGEDFFNVYFGAEHRGAPGGGAAR